VRLTIKPFFASILPYKVNRGVPMAKKTLTDEAIRRAILTRVAVPLWPHTGRALSLGKDATRAAAERRVIPVLDFGTKQKRVPTAFLRKVLGMSAEKVA
jgi:hypothetical protein